MNRNRFAVFFEETETGGNKHEKNLNLWQICVKIYHLFLQYNICFYNTTSILNTIGGK